MPVMAIILGQTLTEFNIAFCWLNRQHTDARYWYIKSVCLSFCLSVHCVPVLDENGFRLDIVIVSSKVKVKGKGKCIYIAHFL